MSKPLLGIKIAFLAANGFHENDLTVIQRALTQAGTYVKIISPENGLINGWNGEGWGHHYAIDCNLSTALGADYSALIIPAGTRSLDKLRLTAHTKRFIGSFMASGKPVLACGDALQIMAYTDQLNGRTVSGPESARDLAVQAGAEWSDEPLCIHGSLFTGECPADEAAAKAFAQKVVDFFAAHATVADQAA